MAGIHVCCPGFLDHRLPYNSLVFPQEKISCLVSEYFNSPWYLIKTAFFHNIEALKMFVQP